MARLIKVLLNKDGATNSFGIELQDLLVPVGVAEGGFKATPCLRVSKVHSLWLSWLFAPLISTALMRSTVNLRVIDQPLCCCSQVKTPAADGLVVGDVVVGVNNVVVSMSAQAVDQLRGAASSAIIWALRANTSTIDTSIIVEHTPEFLVEQLASLRTYGPAAETLVTSLLSDDQNVNTKHTSSHTGAGPEGRNEARFEGCVFPEVIRLPDERTLAIPLSEMLKPQVLSLYQSTFDPPQAPQTAVWSSLVEKRMCSSTRSDFKRFHTWCIMGRRREEATASSPGQPPLELLGATSFMATTDCDCRVLCVLPLATLHDSSYLTALTDLLGILAAIVGLKAVIINVSEKMIAFWIKQGFYLASTSGVPPEVAKGAGIVRSEYSGVARATVAMWKPVDTQRMLAHASVPVSSTSVGPSFTRQMAPFEGESGNVFSVSQSVHLAAGARVLSSALIEDGGFGASCRLVAGWARFIEPDSMLAAEVLHAFSSQANYGGAPAMASSITDIQLLTSMVHCESLAFRSFRTLALFKAPGSSGGASGAGADLASFAVFSIEQHGASSLKSPKRAVMHVQFLYSVAREAESPVGLEALVVLLTSLARLLGVEAALLPRPASIHAPWPPPSLAQRMADALEDHDPVNSTRFPPRVERGTFQADSFRIVAQLSVTHWVHRPLVADIRHAVDFQRRHRLPVVMPQAAVYFETAPKVHPFKPPPTLRAVERFTVTYTSERLGLYLKQSQWDRPLNAAVLESLGSPVAGPAQLYRLPIVEHAPEGPGLPKRGDLLEFIDGVALQLPAASPAVVVEREAGVAAGAAAEVDATPRPYGGVYAETLSLIAKQRRPLTVGFVSVEAASRADTAAVASGATNALSRLFGDQSAVRDALRAVRSAIIGAGNVVEPFTGAVRSERSEISFASIDALQRHLLGWPEEDPKSSSAGAEDEAGERESRGVSPAVPLPPLELAQIHELRRLTNMPALPGLSVLLRLGTKSDSSGGAPAPSEWVGAEVVEVHHAQTSSLSLRDALLVACDDDGALVTVSAGDVVPLFGLVGGRPSQDIATSRGLEASPNTWQHLLVPGPVAAYWGARTGEERPAPPKHDSATVQGPKTRAKSSELLGAARAEMLDIVAEYRKSTR